MIINLGKSLHKLMMLMIDLIAGIRTWQKSVISVSYIFMGFELNLHVQLEIINHKIGIFKKLIFGQSLESRWFNDNSFINVSDVCYIRYGSSRMKHFLTNVIVPLYNRNCILVSIKVQFRIRILHFWKFLNFFIAMQYFF